MLLAGTLLTIGGKVFLFPGNPWFSRRHQSKISQHYTIELATIERGTESERRAIMVNFGLNSASILGIFLALAGAGLYVLRSWRPELSRDYDIFFAAVGLLCGGILFFQGWRFDPIMQFSQLLLASSTIFFAFETIRLRGVTTEQARRSSPLVDDERRVSRTRVYTEAELDRLEPYEPEEPLESNRRLRGYAEPRSSRATSYESEEPRSTRTRRSASRPSNRPETKESPRQRRPRSSPPPAREYSNYDRDYPDYQRDAWDDAGDSWQDQPPERRSRRPRPSSNSEPAARQPRRRPRPSEERFTGTASPEATPTDYVDYQPVDEADLGSSDWEQEPKPERKPERDRDSDSPVSFDY